MAKKLKFPLEMGNDVKVRNMEELQENFILEKVIGYYLDGKLLTWLNDRYYEKEAQELEKLASDKENLAANICKIFNVEYIENEFSVEEIEIRNSKISKLKQYSDDTTLVEKINCVAFSQEEMADLLDDDFKIIYLVEGIYTIPLSKSGIKYIGVGNVTVNIKSDEKVDWKEKQIEFETVNFDEKYSGIEKTNLDKGTNFKENDNSVAASLIFEKVKAYSKELKNTYSPSKCVENKNFLYIGCSRAEYANRDILSEENNYYGDEVRCCKFRGKWEAQDWANSHCEDICKIANDYFEYGDWNVDLNKIYTKELPIQMTQYFNNLFMFCKEVGFKLEDEVTITPNFFGFKTIKESTNKWANPVTFFLSGDGYILSNNNVVRIIEDLIDKFINKELDIYARVASTSSHPGIYPVHSRLDASFGDRTTYESGLFGRKEVRYDVFKRYTDHKISKRFEEILNEASKDFVGVQWFDAYFEGVVDAALEYIKTKA